MSYLVLARKWRPATFEEVVGQQGVVRTLKNAIQLDRVAHAYLFTGARGVGKTTVARILAKALNCQDGPTPAPDGSCTSCREIAQGISPDVFEIDGASNTGVDDVRSLRENSQYLPARSRFKIYIIDEVHMLSVSAFNALLKTLEEPPRHVKFIFATTEPHKIPLTVLSRCQRFDFKRIATSAIFDYLKKILAEEQARIAEEGIRAIAREAAGSMRDALSLTDQVLAFGGDAITAEQVFEALGLTVSSLFEEVIDAILDNQPDELMKRVEMLFDEGHDLKRFLEGLLWHVRHLILFRSLRDADSLVDVLPEERTRLQAQAEKAEPLRWHQMFDILSRCLAELGRNPYPRMVVETALLRLSSIEPLVDLDALLQQVEQLSRKLEGGHRSDPEAGSGGGRHRAAPPPGRSREAAPSRARPDEVATGDGGESGSRESQAPAPRPPGAEDMLSAWEGLVSMVAKRRPSLGSVLTHAQPMEVTSGRVRIALEPGSFFADQMKAKRNRRDLEGFCSEYFGQSVELLVEDKAAQGTPSLAQSREQAARAAEEEMREEALAHPMVQEAIRVFGAKVEQVRSTTPPRGGKDS